MLRCQVNYSADDEWLCHGIASEWRLYEPHWRVTTREKITKNSTNTVPAGVITY